MGKPRHFDLTGQKFGQLTVIKPLDVQEKSSFKWECLCTCGQTTNVNSANLRNNSTNSCGCLRKKISSEKFKTHGKTKSGTYRSWSGMKTRCFNKKSTNYYLYGGRGITVCDRWSKFELFLEDMGERPIGKSLDRIDVNGNYEPSNCQWASDEEQSQNKRKTKMFNKESLLAFLKTQDFLNEKQRMLIAENCFQLKNQHT